MADNDPLRRLLDAVLEDGDGSLAGMAAGAHLSRFHFQRTVRSAALESPSTIRRRVLLERAAWQMQRGASVTDAAHGAEYDSVDGFARAFRRAYGCAPSQLPAAAERGHWLPAPNGLHFHAPAVLYAEAGERREGSTGDVTALLVEHDLEDVDSLLGVAGQLDADHGARRRDAAGTASTLGDSLAGDGA